MSSFVQYVFCNCISCKGFNNLLDLSSVHEDSGKTYACMFKTCFDILVPEYVKFICSDCAEQLKKAFALKEQTAKSVAELHEALIKQCSQSQDDQLVNPPSAPPPAPTQNGCEQLYCEGHGWQPRRAAQPPPRRRTGPPATPPAPPRRRRAKASKLRAEASQCAAVNLRLAVAAEGIRDSLQNIERLLRNAFPSYDNGI